MVSSAEFLEHFVEEARKLEASAPQKPTAKEWTDHMWRVLENTAKGLRLVAERRGQGVPPGRWEFVWDWTFYEMDHAFAAPVIALEHENSSLSPCAPDSPEPRAPQHNRRPSTFVIPPSPLHRRASGTAPGSRFGGLKLLFFLSARWEPAATRHAAASWTSSARRECALPRPREGMHAVRSRRVPTTCSATAPMAPASARACRAELPGRPVPTRASVTAGRGSCALERR
jgi:hypothetical protein